LAVTVTTPETVDPPDGAVIVTVGTTVSAGSTATVKCTGAESLPTIVLWSARTSQPFSVCEPTWTPVNWNTPSKERSITTGFESSWKWT
jgi:hypothetical protein